MVVATELGIDVDAIADVPDRWALCTGFKNLGNALARRLLFLREYLNAGLDEAAVANLRKRVQSAIEEDPRVASATISLALNTQASTCTVGVTVDTATGPFSFVVQVTDLTVEVLNLGVQQTAPATAATTVATPVPGPAGAPGGPGPAGIQGPKGDTGAGGGGGGGFTYRAHLSSTAGTEQLVDQLTVDFSKFAAGTLTLELAARVASSTGVATFKVYVGGNYDAIDGTLVATGTTSSATFVAAGLSGTFTNPTGIRPVKLTITSSAAGASGELKEGTVTVTS
jgi:hypothetical protein